MLTLNCLGSGSKGNCYILSDEQGRVLILDCGIGIKRVKEALNFNLRNICGVFCTHSHADHFSQYNEFVKMGCETLAPHLTDKIRVNKNFYPYTLQAFRLPHGEDSYSYGALIRHQETDETLLYMTDFEYSEYVFKACKINHFLVECNYQNDYVDLDAPNVKHKLSGHCSLKTIETFLKVNKTPYMQNVILCHLGVSTTNPQECVETIENTLGASVVVDYARPNTIYELKDMRLPFSE